MRGRFEHGLVLRALAMLSVAWLAIAATAEAQTSIPPPETYNPVDGNGVNLSTGSFEPSTTAIAIGPEGDGLTYQRTWDTSVDGWRDNAARLAALFQWFSNPGSQEIGLHAFENASRIAAWHLHEARRFFGELALPAELANAAKLDGWLIGYCQSERTHLVGKSTSLQYSPLRKKESLEAAIQELVELDRLQVRKDGKRVMLEINPRLFNS